MGIDLDDLIWRMENFSSSSLSRSQATLLVTHTGRFALSFREREGLRIPIPPCCGDRL